MDAAAARGFAPALASEDALVAALGGVVSRALETAAAPAALPDGAEPASVFFSVTKPDILVETYVRRLVKYAQCSPAAFPAALEYLDRAAAADPKLALNAYNLHRLLLTSLCLAAKFLDDRCYSNGHYARVGGIASVVEMNRLELHLLALLRFRLFVSPAAYAAKEALLVATLAPPAPTHAPAPAYLPLPPSSPVSGYTSPAAFRPATSPASPAYPRYPAPAGYRQDAPPAHAFRQPQPPLHHAYYPAPHDAWACAPQPQPHFHHHHPLPATYLQRSLTCSEVGPGLAPPRRPAPAAAVHQLLALRQTQSWHGGAAAAHARPRSVPVPL